MSNIVKLSNRQLISINGKDYLSFLQGLISNDIFKINDNKLIYTLMLNPQGRFLYEFFIFKYKDGLILDVDANYIDEILKKLSFYKLSSEVNLAKIDGLEVFFSDSDLNNNNIEFNFNDPRQEEFGCRFYLENSSDIKKLDSTIQNIDFYHKLRHNNLIIDENDLDSNKSLIVEYGFDKFNAIDYQKGCYVGQEVVARVHYKGKVRKKIFLIEVDNLDKVEKYSEITCDNKNHGIILSSLFIDNKLQALALIKNIDASDNVINLNNFSLEVSGCKITIKK